ncbi:UNVERIFIED_CONTAM: hypothetical protein HDU68_008723 [Siphonaria sp. JEL0065]|nr:hypothetical protein HDU68_008723 [Siphonaria sp. JEL0065]
MSASLNENKNGWNIGLMTAWLIGSSATVMSTSLYGTAVQGCSAKTTQFDISPQPTVSTFGFSLDDQKTDGSIPGLALKTNNYKPNYFRVFQNFCFKKTAIAALGTQGSSDSLGAVVITTNDGFSSTTLLRDLSQIPSESNSTICYGVSGCTDMQIYYVAPLNSVTVYATSRGIYYSTPLISFTFPASTIVTGILCHANGIDCFVFGSELWHSIDGGQNWLQIYTLATDVFSTFESSRGVGNFVLQTNLKNIYYGRAGTVEIVKVNTFNPKTTNLVHVVMNEMGNVFGLTLETISSSYSSTASDYPMGFLKTITGTIRDSTSPYLNKIRIPLDSITVTADFSFGESLVPVFLGKYRVQFFAMTASSFKSQHIGLMLSLSSGGVAVINSVSSLGHVADCTIKTLFTSDTSTNTPAIARDLVISTAVGSSTTPLVSDSTTTITTSLTISGSGSGTWMYADIGKTVVANHGSFLITGLTSSTIATANVVRAPLSSGTVSSGNWQVYDFRSFAEYGQTGSLALGTGNGVQTVTLSSSALIFTSSLRGMFLVTSDGWGSIQDFQDSTNLKVTWYVAPTTTPAVSGDWSIFDTNDNYVPGAFPSISLRVFLISLVPGI